MSRALKREFVEAVYAPHDKPLIQLLRIAGAALHEEERALNGAFAGSTERAFYQETPQGLAYWLYETTLVYLIFKRWVAMAPVVWDWDRGRRGGALDLVVRQRRARTKIRYAFEAKWWNAGGPALFANDDSKLQALSHGRGFVMAFWWSESSRLPKHDSAVGDFSRRAGWSRIYQATFPMHHHRRGDWRFAMDVIEVPRRRARLA